MKKYLKMLAIAMLVMAMPSCGEDEPDEPQATPTTVSFNKLMTFTFNSGDKSVNYLGTADYTFVDLLPSLATASQYLKMLKVKDVNFDPLMPFAVSFNLAGNFGTNVDFSLINTNGAGTTLGQISNTTTISIVDDEGNPKDSRYTISNLSAMVDEEYNTCTIAYDVNDQYRVVSVSDDIISEGFLNHSVLGYEVRINQDKMTAEVFMYNVQFEVGGAKSPVLKKISVPGVTVETTNGGLKLTGDNIVPTYYMNGQGTPYPALTVTDFTCVINVIDAKMSINFDCHGGNYNDKNVALYLYNARKLYF